VRRKNDVVCLCCKIFGFPFFSSDGLWCRVENDACAQAIRGCSTAQEATDRLIHEAKFLKTHDNTTVCVVMLSKGRII
jgi:serine/threonine protein phosphatase PrpC